MRRVLRTGSDKPTTINAAFFRQRAEELALALGLLSRLPLPNFELRTSATMASAFWAFPAAGGIIGCIAAATLWLALSAGFDALACALLAVTALLLTGGGFHEDGLSDFWDGLGGGSSRETKLDIMRDSRIGVYGALALILTLGLQTAFLVDLQYYSGPATAAGAIIASEVAARGVLALPLSSLSPARSEGLGSAMTDISAACFAGAILIGWAVPLLLNGLAGLGLIAGAAAGAAVVTLLAARFVGGFTGDVLGATVVMARIAALGMLVLVVTP